MRLLVCARRSLLLIAVAGGALAGCGSDDGSVTAGTSATAGGSSDPTVTTTVAPTTTTVPATTAAPTTAPATTAAPTTAPTTTAAEAAGWTPVDPETIGAPLASPCCASNWSAAPSPPLPDPSGSLADGVYAISFDWPADPASPIAATVRRFEACAVLPAGSCDERETYDPEEAGIDPSGSFALELRLDDSLTVVLGGYREEAGTWTGDVRRAPGSTFAELLGALDAAYRSEIGERLAAGIDHEQIVAELRATPSSGFTAPASEGVGALVWTHDDAPPLLFQALDYSADGAEPRGSDVIGRIALLVDGDRLTLTTYAGFYS